MMRMEREGGGGGREGGRGEGREGGREREGGRGCMERQDNATTQDVSITLSYMSVLHSHTAALHTHDGNPEPYKHPWQPTVFTHNSLCLLCNLFHLLPWTYAEWQEGPNTGGHVVGGRLQGEGFSLP